MAKKRINVYWLLLLVLMYCASILLSVGQTEARFNDAVSATTLVGSQQMEITSNCLVAAKDANVTVLGGRMNLITSTKLSFWLKSTGADAVGVLRWGVQNPDHAQYLKITMQSGADVISPEAEIDLLEDVPMELTMTLTPTETARNTIHEEMKIYVLVTWGDRMWGTFQVILPEVKEETEPEGTEPEGTEPEGTEPEGTEPEGTEPEGTEPGETEPGETIPEETDPEDEEKAPIRLETLSRFDAAGMLPVNVVLTEDVTSVRIGLGQTDPDAEEDPEKPVAEVLPLPGKTRFSLDGGENFYMLYEGSVAEFSVEGMTSFTMLLDLRYTGMEVGTGFLLAMDAYAGEEHTANSFARTICGTTKPVRAAVYDKQAYQKRQTRSAEEEEEPLKKQGSYILNQNTVLELTMPEEWQEAETAYSLEFLTLAEDKTLEYKPVSLKTSGLQMLYEEEAQTDADAQKEDPEDIRKDTLVLGIGEKLPPAGTYRINMEWTYEGVCYAKKQMTFFINYAASRVFAE